MPSLRQRQKPKSRLSQWRSSIRSATRLITAGCCDNVGQINLKIGRPRRWPKSRKRTFDASTTILKSHPHNYILVGAVSSLSVRQRKFVITRPYLTLNAASKNDVYTSRLYSVLFLFFSACCFSSHTRLYGHMWVCMCVCICVCLCVCVYACVCCMYVCVRLRLPAGSGRAGPAGRKAFVLSHWKGRRFDQVTEGTRGAEYIVNSWSYLSRIYFWRHVIRRTENARHDFYTTFGCLSKISREHSDNFPRGKKSEDISR